MQKRRHSALQHCAGHAMGRPFVITPFETTKHFSFLPLYCEHSLNQKFTRNCNCKNCLALWGNTRLFHTSNLRLQKPCLDHKLLFEVSLCFLPPSSSTTRGLLSTWVGGVRTHTVPPPRGLGNPLWRSIWGSKKHFGASHRKKIDNPCLRRDTHSAQPPTPPGGGLNLKERTECHFWISRSHSTVATIPPRFASAHFSASQRAEEFKVFASCSANYLPQMLWSRN